MKRLFRRPQDSNKSSQVVDPYRLPQSDADLVYHSYASEQILDFTIEKAVQKQEQRETIRQHHRSWGMESDFRISRGELKGPRGELEGRIRLTFYKQSSCHRYYPL